MSGADALKRKSKGSAMVAAYLDMITNEVECECGYFESARRHNDPADRDFHQVTPIRQCGAHPGDPQTWCPSCRKHAH